MVQSSRVELTTFERFNAAKLWWMGWDKENSSCRDHNLRFVGEDLLASHVLSLDLVKLTLVIPVHGYHLSIKYKLIIKGILCSELLPVVL